MISLWPHPFRLVMTCVVLAAAFAATAPLEVTPAQAQSSVQAEEPVFTSRVITAPRPSGVLPQKLFLDLIITHPKRMG